MGSGQGSKFRFEDVVLGSKMHSRWWHPETWSSGEKSGLPLYLPWEPPVGTWIVESKGLLSTNESSLIFFLRAIPWRCPIHFFFFTHRFVLLLSLIICHPSWDTGMGCICDHVHQSTLKSSKYSSDACNKTNYYWLLLVFGSVVIVTC